MGYVTIFWGVAFLLTIYTIIGGLIVVIIFDKKLRPLREAIIKSAAESDLVNYLIAEKQKNQKPSTESE